jgi:hypothetical protein
MSALKLHTLKQKLWGIFLASFIARIILLLTFPNTASSLAPDEESYAEIARRFSNDLPMTGYEGLYRTSRTLIIPASKFIDAGMESLSAVRFTSTLYSMASLVLIILVITNFLKTNNSTDRINSKNYYLIIGFLAIFAFFPSRLLWSTLGLREAPMEFWLLAALSSLYAIRYIKTLPILFSSWCLFASITFLYFTRSQVALVLLMTILLISFSTLKEKHVPLILVVSISSILLSITLIDLDSKERTKVSLQDYPSKAILELAKTTGEQFGSLSARHSGNQMDAKSAIQTLTCPIDEMSTLGKPFCVAWRAPYMSATFLFRPFILTDVSSLGSLLAGVENLFWLFGFLLLMRATLKRNEQIPGALKPSIVFCTIYVVSAGSYEGNLGTAFRHKSLILWVFLTMFLALYWQKGPEQVNPN